MQSKCRECGCPHTTIHEHAILSNRFFLAERHCDNCENVWLSMDKQSPFKEVKDSQEIPEEAKKINNEMLSVLRDQINDLDAKTKETFVEILDGINQLDLKIKEESSTLKNLTKLLKQLSTRKE